MSIISSTGSFYTAEECQNIRHTMTNHLQECLTTCPEDVR